MSLTLMAQDAAHFIREGNHFYKKGQMAEAIEAYDKAIDSKHQYIALMNKGNALYRQKKYDEAINIYQQAASPANKDKLIRSGAYYNSGVVYSNQKKVPESIEEYKAALRLNWQDEKARENLQKALLELRRNSGGSAQNQIQKQSKSNMSKSQAQQQLDKLEQKEKNTSNKLSKEKSQFGGSAGKDW